MSITQGTTVVARSDGEDFTLSVDDEVVGRTRGSQITVGDLTAVLVPTGERRALDVAGHTRVLRLDPAGRKATWMTLSRFRARLARQRPRPLLRRWVLTRDVEGPTVLRASQTPLGTRVTVDDTTDLADAEVEALVAGTFAEVLGLQARAVADV